MSRDGPRRGIGVLGGTFDPPHVGHLALARAARDGLGLARVLLVPARRPPHKPGGPRLPAALRARLLERACAGEEGLEPCAIELDRPGPSYTADTLEHLAAAHPGTGLWFVLGADQLAGLPGWHEPARILAAARLAVAERPGGPGREAAAAVEAIAPARIDWLELAPVTVSSSEVRARLAEGRPVRGLVPAGVEDALREAGLVASTDT